jgi:hypothetical protein
MTYMFELTYMVLLHCFAMIEDISV